MKQSLFWEFATKLLLYFTSVFGDTNVVNLKQGKIRGSYNILDNYWSYLGIPYAEFRGRFKDAGEPPSWNHTFNANRGNLFCKQYSTFLKTIVGDEDCLTLNVYTPIAPSNTATKPLSVIFFIYGGGYYEGSNTDKIYNPKYIVKKDVVVVTINYRVGAFGFLCLKNNGAPGNMGLKDQLAALRWVKSNIAYFGGDPLSVTLYGESAGAASVDYLILTQSTTDLFQRAIMDSGSSLMPHAFTREPVLAASNAATRLGYNTTNPQELLKIFLNASADDIARISYKDQTNDALAPYIFKPCIEDPNISNKTILTSSPQELVKSFKTISNISIIMGYNSREGIYFARHYNDNGLKMLDTNFSSAVPNEFTYQKPEYKQYLINDIKEFYFNNSSINYEELIDYFSGLMIISPSVATMTAYLSNANITMYNYYFDYDSLRNLLKLMTKFQNIRGASHGDELFYLFDPIIYRVLPPIPRDQLVIDRMTSFWTNFAKTGIPSMNNTWPKSENKLTFLKISDKIDVIDLPDRNAYEFWKKSDEKYTLNYINL